MTTAPADPFARALLNPECYPCAGTDVELQETHISWVFLTGDYAYKVKKPVVMDFLDFRTLESRRHYCNEELRLNRRFAPDLYLDVMEIRGSRETPQVGGSGPLIDYALRMRRFPQGALASSLLLRGELAPRLLTDFAAHLARLHSSLPAVRPASGYGTPESVLHHALASFNDIAPLLEESDDIDVLSELWDWTEREFLNRYGELRDRHARGMVRECHGDLHLGNIVAIHGSLVPFDCIEFSPSLRWNDVMSDVAFLVMDLIERGASQPAWTFTNAYLEATGNYSGLAVLRFYVVYRAIVRAKIHLLRSRQPGLAAADASRLIGAYRDYIRVARRCTLLEKPSLVLMHGLSGSGKSTLAAELATHLGAVRIRSDIERRRLHGLPPLAHSDSTVGGGLYDPEASDGTYRRLAEAAQAVLGGGYTAIVDAAFLRRSQRARLADVASSLGAPVAIVDVQAPEALLRSRIKARTGDPSEATVEVLERQIATAEAISPCEGRAVITADTGPGVTAALVRHVTEHLRTPCTR